MRINNILLLAVIFFNNIVFGMLNANNARSPLLEQAPQQEMMVPCRRNPSYHLIDALMVVAAFPSARLSSNQVLRTKAIAEFISPDVHWAEAILATCLQKHPKWKCGYDLNPIVSIVSFKRDSLAYPHLENFSIRFHDPAPGMRKSILSAIIETGTLDRIIEYFNNNESTDECCCMLPLCQRTQIHHIAGEISAHLDTDGIYFREKMNEQGKYNLLFSINVSCDLDRSCRNYVVENLFPTVREILDDYAAAGKAIWTR